VSIYFQKAFESNQINQNLRSFDTGKFANVLGYHAKYFFAMAYFQLAEAEYKEADKKAKGIGRAATYLKITVAKFDEAKPFVNALGGSYKANFDKKYIEVVALKDKCVSDNQTVYYEGEPEAASIPKPDAQNFVNMISVADEMNATPDLDSRLRHLIPPEVRKMQDEIRNVLQAIVQD
jgi:hypothetical protein